MDQLSIETTPLRRIRAPRVIVSLDEMTAALCREAAEAYLAGCAQRPGEKRSQIAFREGARVFGIPAVQLQSHDDRSRGLAARRQQLMTLSHVVSLEQDPPNSFKAIGRCFHRNHDTVLWAVRKYRDAIQRIIACKS